jgi:putative membrane protein insertion efficiency factor
MNILQKGLLLAIRIYQITISPALLTLMGPAGKCRFTPSCSHYAVESIRLHGATRGGLLAAQRLCRCHPWGKFGEDYPPPAGHFHGS